MSARLADYGVPRQESHWVDVARAESRSAVNRQSKQWEHSFETKDIHCESASIAASISTQADVLSVFLKLVDERDKKTLAAAISRIKEAEQFAEAKLRYALNLDRESRRAPRAPSWFDDLRSGLAGCLPSAIAATGQLLSALGETVDLAPSSVELQPGPDGIVIAVLGEGCRWFVSPSRLPWPGCDVRFYAPERPDSLKLTVEHHRLVPSLLDSTASRLNRNGR